MRMRNVMIAAAMLFAIVARTATADPLEDAVAAGQRGDHATAFQLFQPLAEKGNPKAQTELGTLFHFGWGVPKNDTEAAKWFRMAAEQGYADAQDALGFAYYFGNGVSQNYLEAAKWLTRASEQGLANSQNKLGLMYESGQGVLQDYVFAYMWFNLANAQGFPATQNLERIAASMTPGQIADAQRLAREWRPKPETIVPNR